MLQPFRAFLLLLLGCLPLPAAHGARAEAMVSAANPLAAEAGIEVLRAGGSAVDAAIAVQLVLGLVEPQSSGIGGGAFLLHYRAADGALAGYDGRETAPAAVKPDLFLDGTGEPLPFYEAVVGGISVGVPGLLSMLELAHGDHGRLPWADLFQPAIALAEAGFAISPRLAELIAADEHLGVFPTTAAYFLKPEGTPKAAGTLLVNPAYGATLRQIAGGGAAAFYKGPLAAEIVRAVQQAPRRPGAMTAADLAAYEAKRRVPLCALYRRHQVCSMPPPTSGGLALLQILGMLANFDLPAERPGSAMAVHLIAEASRLAFADRNAFVADPDFVEVAVAELLDPTYLRKRAALIDRSHSLGIAAPGEVKQKAALSPQFEPPSTSHIVVVDEAGNAVSMTSSIEGAFGSRLMVGGFLLNNQLTDFSFRPEVEGRLVANSVAPGKRPRSSMTPTLLLDEEGKLIAAFGSPGGSRIIGFVAKTAIALLDWRLDIEQAVAFPNFVNRNGATELEAESELARLQPELEALGHEVKVLPLVSGLQGVSVTPQGLLGGADPRREGVALRLP